MKTIKTKPYNFLLEMLVVIILFTFCSLIFVELFSISSNKSKEASLLSDALFEVETYASKLKNNEKLDEIYTYDDYKIYIEKIDLGYSIKAISNSDKELISIKVASEVTKDE